MKYLITALIFLSFAQANTEGECGKLFKASNNHIENGNSIIANLNSLYNKQENFIIAKDKIKASKVTLTIQKNLNKAKLNFKKAAPLSHKAISRCSGRSKKAKDLLSRAKSGITEVNFKLKINKRILTNI